MSLLDDFENICHEQDDSMEVKLRKFVIKDKYPIIMGMPEYISKYCTTDSYDVEMKESIHRRELPDEGRVYIVVNSAIDNLTSKVQTHPIASYNIAIDGTWTPISHEGYIMYLKYHEEFWKNADHSTERISSFVSDLILYGRFTDMFHDRNTLVYSESNGRGNWRL
jgi:hypothetical protein